MCGAAGAAARTGEGDPAGAGESAAPTGEETFQKGLERDGS